MRKIIDKLHENNNLNRQELLYLLNNINHENKEYLISKANETRFKYYGDKVYMRGLIEFTNYCKNTCTYCGIRAFNKNVDRYRLSLDQIMDSCSAGYKLGYRTFVLQGGEDNYFTDDKIVEIVTKIKSNFPECAVTLSIGEKSYHSYKKYYNAGADRYLLRHETASKELYEKLHPGMSFKNRRKCLRDLKEIGYQVGAGFMIGIPGQSNEDYVEDLLFLKELEPHMVGIGPFIPQSHTPLGKEKGGTVEQTVLMLSIIRLLLPQVLLPATTALGTIHPMGREMGLKAGANVVMPNLSPTSVRKKYALYDGKICTGDEAAECRMCIQNRIEKAGFNLDMSRGDNRLWRRR
ncbi:[FeFe] hydrogenase H-cluster radical SAM maturase HydE [Clostridium botulinum C]|uniref:[FeFe] hydrogenase H-cluster radical SAM maturase HydE n=2 Tax=Clostridium botulinum TaxID=1491 RepID=A0A9Q4XVB8_CLOBO|nr:[FeFe] hydrogenase H-cluster radical SAM maturase HydE [Clostridium botulinum]MCD3193686.1 [FeFe] hydrogenase H-cluster radical SAM maturase HydE [Clostridium botulinum C]MCD3199754.1 [FeFe] hydrogenase H-cluster radical SAM maturase HydE [Clostridium botulinum C]MCD3205229.1 [FeFe] hydrogenase H-cluster radical SAM maturase HydE [Clostridium botulinum C]MCD3207155.1 [FeFe] hydrogenase H-cluster radical SAM maturase HydE [Clostridium botulinum C]MCD3224557.1 [FeFe] hydrogenase H-cluster rad